MTDLLPCPICGGQPDFQHFNITPNVRGRIICSCGIELRQGKNDTEDDMRIIWNTCAERTCRDTGESRLFRCSECGFGIEDAYLADEGAYGLELDFVRFCPNCGAKVIGG